MLLLTIYLLSLHRYYHNKLASYYSFSRKMSSLTAAAHVPSFSSRRAIMDAISISDAYDGGNGEFVINACSNKRRQ
jgi:hypothetical protein